ncbi:MAG: hypothetical protein L6Q54_04330 [Leptospiraceae bacterium]|nr:hypothetical protein [Leptospiraceae bacterium]MCK6380462.1 hypothetical protein [Leptospiraceae bacterium]
MLDSIKKFTVPHFFGLCFIVTGWFVSIVNIGLDRFTANSIFTQWTVGGLVLIIVGAYLPEIWIGIRNKVAK